MERVRSMTTGRRPPGGRRRLCCLLAACALVIVACAGEDDAAGRAGIAADPDGSVAGVTDRSPDPANCPLDALEQADAPVEITVWHGLVGVPATALEELAGQYNASQDEVRVRVDAQGDYEELFAKYAAGARASGTAALPDVLLAQDTDTRFLVDSDTVVAADDCIAADPGAESHYETLAGFVRATYTVDGLLWPAAFGVAAPVLYYDRAHLEQAGLDPDDPPDDLSELRETAEVIKAIRPEGHPLAFRAASWWVENLSTGHGAALVDNDNGRSGLARRSELHNDTVVEIVEWMADMVDDGLMKVFANSQVAEAPLSVIRSEADSSSMLIDTSSAVTTLDALLGGEPDSGEVGQGVDAPEALDIGVGELPGLSGAGSGQVSGNAWYLVDGGDPERIAAAWNFLRWVTETPQQVKWTVQGSYLPVWQGAVEDPERQRFSADTRAGRWLEVARRSLDSIEPDFPGPLIGPYMELREATGTALERILIEGRPVGEELTHAEAAFQSALDDYARDVGGD